MIGINMAFLWPFKSLNKLSLCPMPWSFLKSCFLNQSERSRKSAVVPSIPNQPIALNPLAQVSGRLYQSGIYTRHVGLTSPPACLPVSISSRSSVFYGLKPSLWSMKMTCHLYLFTGALCELKMVFKVCLPTSIITGAWLLPSPKPSGLIRTSHLDVSEGHASACTASKRKQQIWQKHPPTACQFCHNG